MNTAQEYKPADIILQQMGGSRRLAVMIGAKHFFSDDNGYSLVFKFTAKAKNRANYVKITLDPSDTYTVTFSRIGRKKDKDMGIFVQQLVEISQHEMIYCDGLHQLFELETGLYLTL